MPSRSSSSDNQRVRSGYLALDDSDRVDNAIGQSRQVLYHSGAFTEQLAYQNAQYGIRANVILPGLMNTPMAVDTRAREFRKSRAEVEAERDAKVPLRKKMGTGWDVANAALFLASDEASFITGVTLPVDGGASVRRG